MYEKYIAPYGALGLTLLYLGVCVYGNTWATHDITTLLLMTGITGSTWRVRQLFEEIEELKEESTYV